MNVLVCGAGGFIGRAIAQALRAQGDRVVEGVGRPRTGDAIAVDFARDDAADTWRPRLAGIDAVVNAVGVLRDSPRRPIETVHAGAPIALFEACAAAGVRRIVQISALGIDGDATPYSRSKRRAEQALAHWQAAGRLDATIVRPSIVFGPGGASSALFLRLARLPVLLLPRPVQRARVQPLAVGELAEVVARLVRLRGPARLDAVGPQPLTLAQFIASLRGQGGRRPARVADLPDALTRWSARLGDRLPFSPWCRQTLVLLAADNVAPPEPFQALLGRPATAPQALLHAGGVA